MANSFVSKSRVELLRLALRKLQLETPISNIAAGSVARSLAESITTEIADLYTILDFNTSMSLLSSAQGSALDLLGQLYNVQRKQLGSVATLDQSVGAFYFYIDEPYTSDIVIPKSTRVATNDLGYLGRAYTYVTNDQAVIPAGRTRVFVGLNPEFQDSIYTAGANTLIKHQFESPPLTTVKCTNPKPIAAQVGYEADSNYRARIIKAIRVTDSGTIDALRFAGLQVNGIRDIKINPLVYGLGTVEVIIVPETVNSTSVALAIEAINEVKPVGVRAIMSEPEYVPTSITGTVVIKPGAAVDKNGTAKRVEIGIKRYLNTLLPGDTLVYSRLIQAAFDASDVVTDVIFSRLRVNSRETLRQNYKPAANQQIVPGGITITPV